MRAFIGYIRVSTRKQGLRGLGLRAQRACIEAYAQQMQAEIVKLFKEKKSAKRPGTHNRPEFKAAIEEAEKRGIPVLAASFDRLFRHAPTANEYIMRGTPRFEIAEIGPFADQAVLRGAAAKAQELREGISQNTKHALGVLKKQGKLLGNRTNLRHAQKLGGESRKRTAALQHAKTKAAIDNARSSGAHTLGDIARHLNQQGHPTPSGVAWTKENVRRVLRHLRSRTPEGKLNISTDQCSPPAQSVPLHRLEIRDQPRFNLVGLSIPFASSYGSGGPLTLMGTQPLFIGRLFDMSPVNKLTVNLPPQGPISIAVRTIDQFSVQKRSTNEGLKTEMQIGIAMASASPL